MLRPFKRAGEGPVARGLAFGASDAHAFIDVCYHAILGRVPDDAGLAAYCGMLHDSPDRETLIAVVRSIAMSEEARDYREHHLSSQSLRVRR